MKRLRHWLKTRRPVLTLAQARERLRDVMADVKPIRYRQGYEKPDEKVRPA